MQDACPFISGLSICLFFTIVLSACVKTNKTNEEIIVPEESAAIPVLDISSNLSSSVPDTFTWNSIAERVQFIPLSSGVLLSTSLKPVYIGDNLNIIVDHQVNRISIFDSSGKYKSSFRHVGKGPGEHVYLNFVNFNEADSTIFVFDTGSYKIMTYSLEGKCLDEKFLENKSFSNIRLVDKDGMVYTRGTVDGDALVFVLNENFEVDKELFLFDANATSKKKAATTLACARSETRDAYIVNRAWEDTVFVIENKEAVPFCVLNKSSHALPENEVENILKLPLENDYFTYTSIDCFSSYLLFRYLWKGQFFVELWDNIGQNKIANSTLVQPNQYSDLIGGFNYVFESGKKIRVLPNYVTKNRLVFFLSAEECMSEFEGMKEDDNPVLMVMDLK